MAAGCVTDDLLAAFLEQRISAEDMDALHAHLTRCPPCFSLVADAVRAMSAGDCGVPGKSISSAPMLELADPATVDLVIPGLTSSEMEAAMVGRTVEHYRITRLLGVGGMCLVFEAVHETLPRKAAIKFLRPEVIGERELLARFFNEARAAGHVSHPGVVTIYQDGMLQSDEIPYLVMEFLDGETLAQRFDRLGGEYHPSWVRCLRQIASAMAAVHAQEIVHRDLKLANIILIKDPESGGERAKVLDFGIAKLKERHYLPHDPLLRLGSPEEVITIIDTSIGKSFMGTPQYMSREQCLQAWEVTEKSDVYSLGAIAYRLLSGRMLFPYENLGELYRAQIHEEPQPLFDLVPDWLPRKLPELVHAMLSKDPRKRPTMAEVAAALGPLESDPRLHPPRERATEISSQPQRATAIRREAPATSTTQTPVPAWQNIALAGLVVVLLMALAAYIGYR